MASSASEERKQTDHSTVASEERAPAPSEACRALAEFIGTFFLTFVAAGADIVHSASGGEIAHTSRYLAPGFLIAAMIWSLSGISGAHLNPAVTLTFVLRRSFPLARALVYWFVQFAGALAAATVLRLFFGELIAKGASKPGPDISGWAAVSWEALLTALLILVILGTAENEAVVGKNAALAVGFTVALCGLFSSPISGASMNPARSLGPQIVAGTLSDSWIYVIGPLLGAGVAVMLGYLLFGAPKDSEREAAHGKHQ
ncbi:MAG: aquaporin [Candidatus Eremiobacteraeota bacterium]|nr:aquaporin [Candidatus Eremiobacteraeota bacterium]